MAELFAVAPCGNSVSIATMSSALRTSSEEITCGRSTGETLPCVRFLAPEELIAYLEEMPTLEAGYEATVQGYKVKANYRPVARTKPLLGGGLSPRNREKTATF